MALAIKSVKEQEAMLSLVVVIQVVLWLVVQTTHIGGCRKTCLVYYMAVERYLRF